MLCAGSPHSIMLCAGSPARTFLWSGRKYGLFLAGAVAVIGTFKIIGYIKRSNRRKKWNAAGKDVVVFHNAKRGKFTPSVSPFALKLETYLKLAKIPYEVDFSEPMGPKGKLPWITLNGEHISDSQLIVEELGRRFDINLSAHLKSEELATARAMRVMTEEHFFWCLEIWFVVVDEAKTIIKAIDLPAMVLFFYKLIVPMAKRKIMNISRVQGIGRHTFDEIETIGVKDLVALSNYLGDKKFFTGEKPTEVDCALFGFLAQIVWNYPESPYGKLLFGECHNLVDYCHRFKEEVWPDWNQFLDPPQ